MTNPGFSPSLGSAATLIRTNSKMHGWTFFSKVSLLNHHLWNFPTDSVFCELPNSENMSVSKLFQIVGLWYFATPSEWVKIHHFQAAVGNTQKHDCINGLRLPQVRVNMIRERPARCMRHLDGSGLVMKYCHPEGKCSPCFYCLCGVAIHHNPETALAMGLTEM